MTSSFSAQFEIVKDVTELQNDLTAQKYGYKDVNGDWCAILKVHTDIKDLQFEGLGYEKHDYWAESGIYIVYLQPDTKNIRFIKDEFIALNHDFPFKLKGNSVYQIDIKGVGVEKKIENIIITIQTVPSGGEVYFDGKNIGFVEQIETGVGPHELTVKRSGYEDKTTNIQVSAKNNYFKIDLVPLPGTIQLNKIEKPVDYTGSGMTFALETAMLFGRTFGDVSLARDSLDIQGNNIPPAFGFRINTNINISEKLDGMIRLGILTYQISDPEKSENPEEFYVTQEITFGSASAGIKYKLPLNLYCAFDAGISKVFFRFENKVEDNDHQYDSWDFCYSYGLGYQYKRFDIYLNVFTCNTKYENIKSLKLALGYKFWIF